jgi:hypothetical protein
MSTKPNANLKAVELTQAELDSVAGGGSAAAIQSAAANQAVMSAQAQVARAARKQASLNNAIKKGGASLKAGI